MSVAFDHCEHPVVAAVTGIAAVLDGVADASLWSLADSDLPELTVAAGRVVNQLQGLLTRLVGELDARDLPVRLGASTTAALLRHRLVLTPGSAQALAHTARATRSEFSATGAALSAGELNWAQATAITRAIAELPAEAGDEVRQRAEAYLIGEAAHFDAVALSRLGRCTLEVAVPGVLEDKQAEQLAAAERRDARRREFTMTPDGHGCEWLRGRLDTESAAALRAALDPLSAPRPDAVNGPDPRCAAERRADALIELARRALAGGELPDRGGQRPQVAVTIPLRTLTDRVGHAVLDTGEILSPTAARILACDCTVVPAVLGGAGQVLDLGRSQRLFTGALRRALVLRDRGCAFPGCDRPAAWCDGHHIVHWADGGPTSLENGVLLCGHHHVVVHRDNWQIVLAAEGIPEFRAPAWADPTGTPQRNHRTR